MSLPVWNSLTEEQQGWVQQAMNDSVRYQRELWQQASDDALAKVKAAGVEVIYPDKAAFAAAVQPLHQSLQGTEVGQLMAEIALVQGETAEVSND